MSIREGWIDEVLDGWVFGRIVSQWGEFEFETPILEIPECQRVDLEPGAYISIVNGFIAINKTIWTTHDIEEADKKAKQFSAAIHWS